MKDFLSWTSSFPFVEWSPFFLGTGIAVYFSFCGPPDPEVLCLMVALWGGMGLTFFLRQLRESFLWKGFFVVITGFLLSEGHVRLSSFSNGFWFVKRPIFNAIVSGTVFDISFSTRPPTIILKPPHLKIQFQTYKEREWQFSLKKGFIRLKLSKDSSIPQEGDIIQLSAALFPLQGKLTPNGFDAQRAAYFSNMIAQGQGRGNLQKLGKERGCFSFFQRIKESIKGRLHKVLPTMESGIAAALIVGDRSAISDKVRQMFVDAGIAHVLAISGLHLTLVTGLFFVGIRRFLCLFPLIALTGDTKKLSVPCALLGGLFYLAISGAALATQRAFVMVVVTLVAILLDRPSLPRRSLMLAALILLSLNPISLFMPSFHLSFFAVLALVTTYNSWQKRIFFHLDIFPFSKLFYYGKGVFLSSMLASFATIPFTIYHFQKFTVHAITTNLLVIPLMGFWIMPCGLIAVLLMGVKGDLLFLKAMGLGISVMMKLADFVSQLPGSSLRIPESSAFVLPCIMVGSFFLWMTLKKMRLLGSSLVGLGILLPFFKEGSIVFINSNITQVGVFQAKGILWVTQQRHPTFSSRAWSAAVGLSSENVKAWPQREKRLKTLTLPCGEIAYARTSMEGITLCGPRRVIISKEPFSCAAAIAVITPQDLYQYEAHFITCRGEAPIITTAIPKDSTWPWHKPFKKRAHASFMEVRMRTAKKKIANPMR